jgi:hypothetical protein
VTVTRGRRKAIKHELTPLPGYTILVFDTNILVTELARFRQIVESRRFTVIVPLAGQSRVLHLCLLFWMVDAGLHSGDGA